MYGYVYVCMYVLLYVGVVHRVPAVCMCVKHVYVRMKDCLHMYFLSRLHTYVYVRMCLLLPAGPSRLHVDFTMFLQRNVGMYARDMYVFC